MVGPARCSCTAQPRTLSRGAGLSQRWRPAPPGKRSNSGGRGRPAAKRSAARGMTGSKGGGAAVAGEPGGTLASGASGGAAPAPDRTGERGERLPRSGNERGPRGGRSGRSPEDRESGRGNPPEGAAAASPAERECRRFRSAGAARPLGEAGRRRITRRGPSTSKNTSAVLWVRSSGLYPSSVGDQLLGLLFAPGFHLDGARVGDDLRDGHAISRHGSALLYALRSTSFRPHPLEHEADVVQPGDERRGVALPGRGRAVAEADDFRGGEPEPDLAAAFITRNGRPR